jgi:dihydroorotase
MEAARFRSRAAGLSLASRLATDVTGDEEMRMDGGKTTLLKNAHVIDPAQGIDRAADVAIVDGKIGAVGSGLPAPEGAEIIDLSGQYLSPGWIDLHVHAYGTLGFGDPDSIGIYQGVTSFVDAGGTGIKTLDECMALSDDRLITSLYAGPHIFPMGIVGLSYVENEEDVRSIREAGVDDWLRWNETHPGLLRYVKVGAYSPHGPAPIEIAKRVAERLELPLYIHIGENYATPNMVSPFEDAIRTAQAGDIVTHVYHKAVSGRIVDGNGKILPVVQDAAARGVLFDIGFGSYGFSWDVAEQALAQGLKANFISSDLQQFNVLSPTYSLANVMTICYGLGLTLSDVIDGVTDSPARALSLSDRAGSLRVGLPADLTVFRVEKGRFEISDCFMAKRVIDSKIEPVMAFKAGRRVDSNLALAQDERNWFMQIADDHLPDAAEALSSRQVEFLGSLRSALAGVDWDGSGLERLSLVKATQLQEVFNAVRQSHSLSLKDGLNAVYDSFLDNRFPMQIGLFLARLERPFALSRLAEITGRGRALAAE